MPQAPEPPSPGVAGDHADGYCDRKQAHGVSTPTGASTVVPSGVSTVIARSSTQKMRRDPAAEALIHPILEVLG